MLKRFEFRQVINEYLPIKKEKEGKEIKLYWKKSQRKTLETTVLRWKVKKTFNQGSI